MSARLKRYWWLPVLLLVFLSTFWPLNRWGMDANQCREQGGFCWAFLRAKLDFLIFGTYPRGWLWRPMLVLGLSAALFFWAAFVRHWNRWFLLLYLITVLCSPLLMGGSGESQVAVEQWGGLPLSAMLILSCLLPGIALGIMLALARRSSMPLVKWFAVAWIELVRSVPLISLLFMASLMWPLFFPPSMDTPKLLRAMLVLSAFIAAYMAEVVRGGLQAIGSGQDEAARALGLTFWQRTRLVILPQAIAIVARPMVNTVIGMAKDTSLVMIIALFDFMGTVKVSLSDMDWPGFSLEAYVFAGAVYYFFCRYLSWVGERWQATHKRGEEQHA